ncbi:hypothetical protein OW763_05015 [Clostridium aestuarii]|uniref:Uncharacterized protein n=1 Tax=Clostridium aestuarii TaxID=338193 RepID=A0ABT4CXJ0_9CLOT|nr:hypothetical protein [Clostridium aestuarii]MCY6483708.1 hypothetical protein [Clostridium aestuarii]
MGLKEKLSQRYAESYLKKYGDRITQAQGKVLSVKIQEKSILWIFHKLTVTVVVKPDRSRNVTKCLYRKNRWFKKPEFMNLSQGHSVVVQGVKGKKGKGNSELIEVMNIFNLTTKKQLVPVEGGDAIKKLQKAQKVKYR